ncbi:unnamed protein product [Eretmochelys imbricata]
MEEIFEDRKMGLGISSFGIKSVTISQMLQEGQEVPSPSLAGKKETVRIHKWKARVAEFADTVKTSAGRTKEGTVLSHLNQGHWLEPRREGETSLPTSSPEQERRRGMD